MVLYYKKKFSFFENYAEMKLSTLEKGLSILALFNKSRSVMSVQEIASLISLPKSTTYRYIATLKSQGLIEEDTKQGHYRLGLKILELAQVVRKQGIIDLSFPIMEQLSEQTGETVILAGIYDRKGICLEKVEGRHSLRVSYERGTTFHLHAGASGKVLMAYLSEEERDSIIKLGLPQVTENTITNPHRLRESLRKIREEGFAVSDGEVHEGVRAIAAPIFGRGKIVASLSVGAPIQRLDEPRKEGVIQLTVEAANKITELIDKYGL
jgi:DNA-binding IclR family transcriptional regulator